MWDLFNNAILFIFAVIFGSIIFIIGSYVLISLLRDLIKFIRGKNQFIKELNGLIKQFPDLVIEPGFGLPMTMYYKELIEFKFNERPLYRNRAQPYEIIADITLDILEFEIFSPTTKEKNIRKLTSYLDNPPLHLINKRFKSPSQERFLKWFSSKWVLQYFNQIFELLHNKKWEIKSNGTSLRIRGNFSKKEENIILFTAYTIKFVETLKKQYPQDRLSVHRIANEITIEYSCHKCNAKLDINSENCSTCFSPVLSCIICLQSLSKLTDLVYFTCCAAYIHKKHQDEGISSETCPNCRSKVFLTKNVV